MHRPNLTKPFWAASASLLLFVAGLLTSVILVEECHTERECNFNDPDAEQQCPEGLECCENSICCQIVGERHLAINPSPLPPPTLRPCDVGEAITPECVCVAPNRDRGGTCTGPDPIPLSCQSPIVQTTLRRLDAACKEHGGIGSCPPDKIRAFVIDNKDTLLALASSQAPHSVSIHFETGAPAPGQGLLWASAHQGEILAFLRRHIDLSQKTGFWLLVIGNSKTSTDKINIPIARERSAVAHELLALLKGAPDGPLANVRPLEGLVATELAISPQDFRAHWGSAGRFIGPSKAIEQAMRRQLARHGDDPKWLVDMINQAVILIPIPCDIDAFTSAATPV